MGKIRLNSLTGKMILRLSRGMGVGILVFLILYFGCMETFYPYILTSNYVKTMETNTFYEFQDFVSENHISANDYENLRDWAAEYGVDRMYIIRGRWLLFDSAYKGEISENAQQVSLSMFQNAREISFSDGEASVVIDEGYGERYADVILALSVIAGFFVCLGIFVTGMHEDIVYIKKLKEEVSVISNGDLKKDVTIQGRDELAQLARGLDQMRLNLMNKEKREKEMRLAQEKLVLGMSHDLRTPLTGLMTYMEILKQQQKEGKLDNPEFIEKSMDKLLQIRTLSDDMFEYFLVTSHREISFEEPEILQSVLGDYLSELCSFLEYSGFSVDTDKMEWKTIQVRINIDYIGRIFNNIISNLEKYADREKPVQLSILYEGGQAGICIRNKIVMQRELQTGTGIGIKNITLMMEQMGGSVQEKRSENEYAITLYFPVVTKCENSFQK